MKYLPIVLNWKRYNQKFIIYKMLQVRKISHSYSSYAYALCVWCIPEGVLKIKLRVEKMHFFTSSNARANSSSDMLQPVNWSLYELGTQRQNSSVVAAILRSAMEISWSRFASLAVSGLLEANSLLFPSTLSEGKIFKVQASQVVTMF